MINACDPPQVSCQDPAMWDPKTHPNLSWAGVLVLAIKDGISLMAESVGD